MKLSDATPVTWESILHRLGKEPDTGIAEELGVTRAAVQIYRKKRGIPKFIKYPVTPAIAAFVREHGAEISNTELARRFRVPYDCAVRARIETDAPSYQGRTPFRDTPEMRRYAGKMSDPKAASALEVKTRVVYYYRRKHRIPSFCPQRRLMTKSQRAMLRKMAGQYTDARVTQIVRVAKSTVSIYRRKHGIQSYAEKRRQKITSQLKLYAGKMSDRKVADKIGCSTPIVSDYRREYGVPAWRAR